MDFSHTVPVVQNHLARAEQFLFSSPVSDTWARFTIDAPFGRKSTALVDNVHGERQSAG